MTAENVPVGFEPVKCVVCGEHANEHLAIAGHQFQAPEKPPIPECADDEHDWKHVSDWAGDPGVINGTYDIRYKECRICGKQEDDSDYDAGSDFDDNYF